MDSAIKEFSKLQKVVIPHTSDGQEKSSSLIVHSVGDLIKQLYELKERLENGAASREDLAAISSILGQKKKEIEEKQKEQHTHIARFGKALDKAFPNPLPTNVPMFQSDASIQALDRHVALHFMRSGQFSIADEFLKESRAVIADDFRRELLNLHSIIIALRNENIQSAMNWCNRNTEFLKRRSSSLEFRLHRSQFVRLLTHNETDPLPALSYAQNHFPPLYANYSSEIRRLLAMFAFLPLSNLMASPYADLLSQDVQSDLELLFAQEYCASLGMTRQIPLHVLSDIGGGGGLARIEKAKKVMREKRSEWSQDGSSLIEIPLAPEYRYHSVFACPVSKEQATQSNPPMMLTCGHVVAKESLQRLNKPQGKVKCPYCPIESQQASALQVYF